MHACHYLISLSLSFFYIIFEEDAWKRKEKGRQGDRGLFLSAVPMPLYMFESSYETLLSLYPTVTMVVACWHGMA